MNDWQEFIQSQNIVGSDDEYICDASDLGLILVNGEDAANFLQNQFSNDINLIDQNSFQLSSYSTPKGRMLGIFRVVKIENGYLLIMPGSILPKILQRLQMYVVQAKVTLADASAYFARFAIQSEKISVIDNIVLPREANKVFQSDSLISLHLGVVNQQSRYLILDLSVDEAKSIWQTFAKLLSISHFYSWRLSEIKAGIPVIYPENSEEFVAQMANLNFLNGINFKKGCYPGQEIVARMQYLGKLKRRMFLAELNTSDCPAAGDNLVALASDNIDGSGKVVDAVTGQDNRCYCLFIAQIKKAEDKLLRFSNSPGTEIKLLELPYALSE
ncbi:MAG: folate-binding protein YgfZ [Gammaproteobacteria bacterium]|nr:folate-binding protein YgfZ [Gammaproteobacteria bacterium]